LDTADTASPFGIDGRIGHLEAIDVHFAGIHRWHLESAAILSNQLLGNHGVLGRIRKFVCCPPQTFHLDRRLRESIALGIQGNRRGEFIIPLLQPRSIASILFEPLGPAVSLELRRGILQGGLGPVFFWLDRFVTGGTHRSLDGASFFVRA
jgi:hypothetical protein